MRARARKRTETHATRRTNVTRSVREQKCGSTTRSVGKHMISADPTKLETQLGEVACVHMGWGRASPVTYVAVVTLFVVVSPFRVEPLHTEQSGQREHRRSRNDDDGTSVALGGCAARSNSFCLLLSTA